MTVPQQCSQCHSSCLTCQGPLQTQCLSCGPGLELSPSPVGSCRIPAPTCQCRLPDNSCLDECPQEFIPSSDPEEFVENAALTFLVELQASASQTSGRIYKVKFSDPPVLLLSPLTYDNLDTLLKVELQNYQNSTDYEQTLSKDKLGIINIKINPINPIKSTELKV